VAITSIEDIPDAHAIFDIRHPGPDFKLDNLLFLSDSGKLDERTSGVSL